MSNNDYTAIIRVKYSGWFRSDLFFARVDNVHVEDKIDSMILQFDQKTIFGLRHKTIHLMKKEITSITIKERIKEKITA